MCLETVLFLKEFYLHYLVIWLINKHHLTFQAWLKQCMDLVMVDQWVELLVLLWFIWKAKNDELWFGKDCNPP
ncbi:hypothetical protein RchiOBHm_Chr0c39g0503161 [Rosa chinensis]|uniref:Uncharacterized protein n=1 Tax=Rosa chinensis TaxID=74649 RepID=A0A2P6SQ55_ROSCH|nr:hypothetical protein RchiOBHm_Chr0c39g0503161 [Rosa chinensis]